MSLPWISDLTLKTLRACFLFLVLLPTAQWIFYVKMKTQRTRGNTLVILAGRADVNK